MQSLENKSVLITGGSRGIGKAIAFHFAKKEANVAICARSPEPLAKAEKELLAISPTSMAVQCDASKKQDIENCVKQVKERFGKIDILINNAGTYVPGNILDTSVEEWDRQFEINLKGPFLMTQAVVPHMIDNGGGIIIFVSSTIGLESPAGISLYTATKWGLDGFSGSISPELLDENIKVHTLRPGFTDTSIFDEIGKPDIDIDWLQPEELAHAAEYLCTLPQHAHVPELTYMTTFQRKGY